MSAQRRKVLFLIPSLSGGGAERVFSILLRYLDHDRFDPHLGILEATGTFIKDIPQDVVIHELHIPRVRYALPAIIRLVRKVRPHTLLSTLGNLNIALILTRFAFPRGTRLLVREAAIASTVLKEETRHPRLWNWLYRHFYRRADKVICLSDSMVNDMVEHFDVPREKLVRIYNPVDTQRVREMGSLGRSPYSGPGPHLVAAGRLTRQKGFDILLEAMPSVLESLPDAQLAILGEGPLLKDLMEQAQRLGLSENLSFLGFQKNPWPYFKHADVFLLPSRYEGTPNAVLEALALGTPVIAADCPGGVREIQTSCARIVLVPVENSRALVDAIVSTCQTPKQPEGGRQLENCLSAFDVHQVVSEYSRLF